MVTGGPSADGPKDENEAGFMSLRGKTVAGRLSVALVAAVTWGSLGSAGLELAPAAAAAGAVSATPADATAPASASATCADTVLASMTMSERIGQLFNVGLPYTYLTTYERSAIAQYHFGSVWLARHWTEGAPAVRALTSAVQAQATWAATHHVRFFIAANQEGGLVQALNGSGFDVMPTALTQGTWSTTTLWSRAQRWGSQLRAAGLNLNFAPVADTVPPGTDNQNPPIGKLKREFGHYVSIVSPHAAAFFGGMRAAHVFTTAKHFPGLGRVTANTDNTANVTDTITTRNDYYIVPFKHAVDLGEQAVMVSLATYTKIDSTHQAVFSPTVIGGMLRGDLGFGGIVMSDSLSAAAVTWLTPGDRAIRFLNAGGDMIVLNPFSQAITMAKAIATHAGSSPWFRGRVNNAALHILRQKQAAGLLPC
jgi:beta-N-acetylhexosaminidase